MVLRQGDNHEFQGEIATSVPGHLEAANDNQEMASTTLVTMNIAATREALDRVGINILRTSTKIEDDRMLHVLDLEKLTEEQISIMLEAISKEKVTTMEGGDTIVPSLDGFTFHKGRFYFTDKYIPNTIPEAEAELVNNLYTIASNGVKLPLYKRVSRKAV